MKVVDDLIGKGTLFQILSEVELESCLIVYQRLYMRLNMTEYYSDCLITAVHCVCEYFNERGFTIITNTHVITFC